MGADMQPMEERKKRDNAQEKKADKENFSVTVSYNNCEMRTRRKFKGSDLVSNLQQCIADEITGCGVAKMELVYMGKHLMSNVCELFCCELLNHNKHKLHGVYVYGLKTNRKHWDHMVLMAGCLCMSSFEYVGDVL